MHNNFFFFDKKKLRNRSPNEQYVKEINNIIQELSDIKFVSLFENARNRHEKARTKEWIAIVSNGIIEVWIQLIHIMKEKRQI